MGERECLAEELLPPTYRYKLIAFNVKEYGENIKCDIETRVDVETVSEVKTFLSELNTSTGCTFNVKTGRPDRQGQGLKPRIQYGGYRKCCMQVAHDKKREQTSWKKHKL